MHKVDVFHWFSRKLLGKGWLFLDLLYACLPQNYTQDQLAERKAKMEVGIYITSQQLAWLW